MKSRGLAPRFIRLAAKKTAIRLSGRVVCDAVFAAFYFGLSTRATCWLIDSSAEQKAIVLWNLAASRNYRGASPRDFIVENRNFKKR
jgi:hypothetical protein